MKVEETTTRSVHQREALATRSHSSLPSILTLAIWSFRQTWWQMLLAGVALLTAVMVSSIVPLFSAIATTASLQEVFSGNALRSDFALSTTEQGLSTTSVNQVYQRFNQLIRPAFGSYLDTGQAPLVIQLPGTDLNWPGSRQNPLPFVLYATSLQGLKPDLTLVQGNWPSSSPGVFEIMLSVQSASALHLSVGAEMTLSETFTTTAQDMQNGPGDPSLALHVRLAGTFDVTKTDAPALFGQHFQPVTSSLGTTYTILAPADSLLAQADQWAKQNHSNALFSTQPFQLTWYYHLATATLQTSMLDELTIQLNTTEQKVGLEPTDQSSGFASLPTFPYVLSSQFYNPLPQGSDFLNLLQQHTTRVALVNIPVLVLAILVILLLFFFACLLLNMLIDRQMTMNALLSSRGASPGQVFWSLVTQGLLLCLLALCAGPVLATTLVITIARQALAGPEQGVIALTLGHSWQIPGLIAPYVAGTVIAEVLIVGLILRRSIGNNILDVRHEASRASQQPFWLRYYLDILASVIALSGFGVSLYLASIARTLDAGTQDLIIAPLTLIAPIFLLLAFLLLFLRLFPLFLRFCVWCNRPARGVTGMLALVQMSRSPRPAMRMTMLLALAISFAFFVLVLDASQAQRALDVATYESGADFSGSLPASLSQQTLSAVTNKYTHVRGVLSATAGFVSDGNASGFDENDIPLELRAVDAQTFAHTASWGALDSTQSLSELMHQLLSKSSAALVQNGQIPVIIDESTLNQLDTTPGDSFFATINGLASTRLGFTVIAVVTHIPTINNSPTANDASSPGGLLADFTALQKIYQARQKQFLGAQASGITLPVNYLWLRSRDDASSLAAIRTALDSTQLGLSSLYDRRDIVTELQNDPLYVNMLLLLTIGGVVALSLALVGDLVASWLSVRTRRSNFVVLRALGANARQIAALLLCEQMLIYCIALALSIIFGLVLANFAVPALVFTGLPAKGGMSELSTDSLYLLQQIIPVQVVTPLSLRFALAGMGLLCILTLALMVRAALRPSMIQELRLNED